jgi:hypothetical protein
MRFEPPAASKIATKRASRLYRADCRARAK